MSLTEKGSSDKEGLKIDSLALIGGLVVSETSDPALSVDGSGSSVARSATNSVPGSVQTDVSSPIPEQGVLPPSTELGVEVAVPSTTAASSVLVFLNFLRKEPILDLMAAGGGKNRTNFKGPAYKCRSEGRKLWESLILSAARNHKLQRGEVFDLTKITFCLYATEAISTELS